MEPRLREVLRASALNALRVVDITLIMLAFGVGVVTGLHTSNWTTWAEFLSSKVSLSSCILFGFAMMLCYAAFSACGLYQSKRLSTKRSEVTDVLCAMTLSTGCLALEGWASSILVITPRFLVVFWFFGSSTVIVTRFLLRFILAAIRKRGRNLHHILVLGTNARAIEFARKIVAMPDRGYRLLGFVDDSPGMEPFRNSSFRLACSFDDLPEFLRHNVVDEVANYLPLRSFYERAVQIARLAKQHGILLRFDSNIFDLDFAHLQAERSEGPPHIMANGSGIDGWPLLFKRLLDIVASALLLIALSPLFLVVAVLVKLTSAGPVLFKQRRVGLNKRAFTVLKFRTMVRDAESTQDKLLHLNEMTGPVFKIKDDPRVTSLGRVLRKTSIDELPQLFNVLKGDMSLVGPRAMSVRDYQLFSEDWQRRRFSVRPGITCLWQVHGRNTIPFEQWMLLDMQYIDKWSLWLDFKILAQTIPAVLKGSGAV